MDRQSQDMPVYREAAACAAAVAVEAVTAEVDEDGETCSTPPA